MLHEFSRTEQLIGKAAIERLKQSRVAVFGIGGVGSFVTEGLARSGIGHFVLIDHDRVSLTNLNRQLIATHATIGRLKVEVMRERILAINPAAEVEIQTIFVLPETADGLIRPDFDYVVDAVDTVAAKIELAVRALALGIPVISSMGAGNKLDPTRFEVTDIFKTNYDPLSKVMRRELKKRGIEHLKVVYSPEPPLSPAAADPAEAALKRRIPGSIAFVPSVAGLIIAGEVVKDLIRSAGIFSGPGYSPETAPLYKPGARPALK
jgi:tRNA A37 threonylcarbamoyladenosine dehydratase